MIAWTTVRRPAAAAVAAGLLAGGMGAGGFGAGAAVAQPGPPVPVPLVSGPAVPGPAVPPQPGAAEVPVVRAAPPPPPGEIPPPWAPPKPNEMWNGEPVVWFSGWGGRWGVWKYGQFITLSSNVNTGGG